MELSFQLNPFILYTIGVCFLAHIIFKVSQLFVSRHRQAVALKDFPGPAPHWLYGNIKEVSYHYTNMTSKIQNTKGRKITNTTDFG